MKKYLFLLVCSALLFSCNDEEGPAVCGVENPVEDLVWLKEAVEFSQSNGLAGFAYLIQGTYKGKTVFIMENCCPFCLILSVVQDCRGVVIPDASVNDVTNKKVIWKPANSGCNFT
ncbi:MAG: hypothetical protein ACJLTB_21445 [Algoriphagus aquaeductus]|uniref:hypothetical protein n=1 Tax=Algoriphagus aquaeductus TaxID=475299 RepID=UPI00387A4891